MKRPVLSIDARMLFSSGIGTYLQNMLKRLRLKELGLGVDIYVYDEREAAWIKQYQPEANIRHCPIWIYGIKEQLFWLKNLKGGAFWSPHFNIPWAGYEKLIVTVHDTFQLTAMAPFFVKLYARVMFARILQKADAVMTVSDFSKQELILRAGVAEKKIKVIYNGVAPSWFTNNHMERPYPFEYLVYVGNLKPHKNLYRLLQAYAQLSPSQKLVCVGPFKNLRSRDNRARRLMEKMRDRVIVMDTVEDEPLRAIVKNACGLVLPSLYEGFGLPPLEAMAAGVPVLVSDSGPLPEVCGASALYCQATSVDDIARGLSALINLPKEERARHIEEGYVQAAKFNWDNAAQAAYEVLFKTLS